MDGENITNLTFLNEDEPVGYFSRSRYSPSSLSDLSVESGFTSASSNDPIKFTHDLDYYKTQLNTVVDEFKKRFTTPDNSLAQDTINNTYIGFEAQTTSCFESIKLDYSSLINSLNFSGSQEDAQLELSTVISIIELCGKIKTLIETSEYSMTTEVFDNAYNSTINLINLFKYHFQLPPKSPNFAFKNFGYLFRHYQIKIWGPLLRLVFLSTQFNYHKQERLKNCFCLSILFSLIDKNLFDLMFSEIRTPIVYDLLNFCIKNLGYEKEEGCAPGALSLFAKFQMSLDLEKSTLTSDKSTEFLLEALFSDSKGYIFIHLFNDLTYVDQMFNQLFDNKNTNNRELMNLVTFYTQNKRNQELVALYCITHDHTILKINAIMNTASVTEILKRVTCKYLLLSISETLISHFSLKVLSVRQDIQDIYYNNINQNYQQILGVQLSSYEGDVSDATFSVLFEVLDQNFRIDLLKEENLLSYLKASLFSINLAITKLSKHETNETLLKLHLMLQELGCTLSLHSIFEMLGYILSTQTLTTVQYIKDKHSLTEYLTRQYEFNITPPFSRANFSFENTIQLEPGCLNTSNDEYATQLFNEIAKANMKNTNSLIYDCILLCSSIKSKINSHLHEVNEFNNAMYFSSAEALSPKKISEQTTSKNSLLYEFRLKNFSSIPIFELGNALDFKILNQAHELSLESTLGVLVFGYGFCKSTKNLLKVDILYHFVVDSLINFVLIYKEFGLFSIFKFFKCIISHDATLIPLCSQLLAILLRNQKLANIIDNTNTISALVRQFVESYDDGESIDFKEISKFLKKNPSPIKPSRIAKGKIKLNYEEYLNILTI